ncbi:cytochrome P450 734A1 [Senna tora]|uniref:Cytochrome P450 734A1 n=1 Tax=Senna tora TaxID=362788 RepID=A0A834X4U7_9FABA|nr:cytochrome P450 734A1 [Senna tora]
MEAHFWKQGIRGPPYRFFIGNVRELASMMLRASSQPMPFLSHNILPRVLSFYHHWNKIYGTSSFFFFFFFLLSVHFYESHIGQVNLEIPGFCVVVFKPFGGTFLVWFGPTVRVTVSDPELIREIFSSKSESYEKNEAPPIVKQLEGDGLLSLKGQKWAYHRKIISPAFHMENLKVCIYIYKSNLTNHSLLIPVMERSVVEMLEKWKLKEGEVEIEVVEWFQNLTEDVITRAAFGSSYEDGKAIFKLQAQQMLLAADAFHKAFIPGYRRNINCWKLDKEIKKSVGKVIEKRRKLSSENNNYCSSELELGGKDLVGLMMKASKSKSWDDDDGMMMMSVDEMVEECKSFFFAGKHTTSNLLTWTTILLAMHPHWQVRARDELFSLCPSRDLPPSKDDLPNLKTLSMIVNESLRLYPPTIATIRRAKTDVELGNYQIPRGTELLIPILAVHHDQSLWGTDANEFNPGRFSEGVARAAKHPVAFIPFGLSVRTCIGQNLAVLQTKLALAIILQRFSFRLSPSYKHAPTVLMLLYPQYGAPIIFRRLSSTTDDDDDDDDNQRS